MLDVFVDLEEAPGQLHEMPSAYDSVQNKLYETASAGDSVQNRPNGTEDIGVYQHRDSQADNRGKTVCQHLLVERCLADEHLAADIG